MSNKYNMQKKTKKRNIKTTNRSNKTKKIKRNKTINKNKKNKKNSNGKVKISKHKKLKNKNIKHGKNKNIKHGKKNKNKIYKKKITTDTKNQVINENNEKGQMNDTQEGGFYEDQCNEDRIQGLLGNPPVKFEVKKSKDDTFGQFVRQGEGLGSLGSNPGPPPRVPSDCNIM